MSSRKTNNLGKALKTWRGGRSIERLAELVDVSRNTMGSYFRGDGSLPDIPFLERYAKVTNAPLSVLIAHLLEDMDSEAAQSVAQKLLTPNEAGMGSTEKYKERVDDAHHVSQDFVMVPRYDVHGSAGHGAITHSEQIVDYLAFRGEWVRNALGVSQKDLALISVKGDSMEPTLSNEDLILIDMRKGCVEDNAIYVLQHNGDLLVKRIQRKLDGSVVVKSDNPRYDPETLNQEMAGRLVVVGRVVWSGRRM